MEDRILCAGVASYPAGLHLRVHVYQSNNRPALSLVCADDFMPYVDLTCNVPCHPLADDEVFVAAWNVPVDVLAALLETELFAPVRMLSTGFARGPVWKIQSTELLEWIADARADAAADASPSA
ncbi:hypothetical protein LMG23992_04253 [Cupriavidus laharis]|uniref:Helix-turn-helix domain-containing protein n=1 Tax=Cupriavidus laharis TaxID=151654 RepID=A0ABM8XJX8_9BURK|nr:hypothetical protein [Cupriavidus laharis]CAG9180482.1 hypothetical protein LMG23992_04253 [Cupriavidus laharis]